jgi:hypothetical protein
LPRNANFLNSSSMAYGLPFVMFGLVANIHS